MGRILLEKNNLLTEVIPEDIRDKSIDNFGKMHKAATNAQDEFYALESLYGDQEAPIYRYFKPWEDFIKQKYGKSITLNSWQTLQQVFVQRPNLKSIASRDSFFMLEKPLAKGGFFHPKSEKGLLVDVVTWREWKEKWFCEHQEMIDWSGKEGAFFVNDDIIEEILTSENRKFAEKELRESGKLFDDTQIDSFILSKVECHVDEDLSKGLKKNAAAIFFHSFVMNNYSGDGERQGYTESIGSLVCKSNYYIKLTDLASMERNASPSGRNNTQRTIYGMKMAGGRWRFISFDFEKGMFEFHDDNGAHLGEFRFDGSKNADAQLDHNLRCVELWKSKLRL